MSDGVEGVSNIDDEGFTVDLSRLLAAAGLAASRGEAQRLLRQNAVEVDGVRASGDSTRVAWGAVVRAGRRRYVRRRARLGALSFRPRVASSPAVRIEVGASTPFLRHSRRLDRESPVRRLRESGLTPLSPQWHKPVAQSPSRLLPYPQ